MVRAAAKYKNVLIITNKKDYKELGCEIENIKVKPPLNLGKQCLQRLLD